MDEAPESAPLTLKERIKALQDAANATVNASTRSSSESTGAAGPPAQGKLPPSTSSSSSSSSSNSADLALSSLTPHAHGNASPFSLQPTRSRAVSRAVSLVQSDPLDAIPISSGSTPTRSPSRPDTPLASPSLGSVRRDVDPPNRTRAETIATTLSVPSPRPVFSSRERSSSAVSSRTLTPNPGRPAQVAPGVPPRPCQTQTPSLLPTVTDPLTTTPTPSQTDSPESRSTSTFPTSTSTSIPIPIPIPTSTSPVAPRLPPRRSTSNLSTPSTLTIENRPVPALPPRPRSSARAPSPRSLDPVPSMPTRREPPQPLSTSTRSCTPSQVDALARKRYSALFDLLVQRFGTVDGSPNSFAPTQGPRWIPKQNNGAHEQQGTRLDARVVTSVWVKSRLDTKVLGRIWTQCDASFAGSLGQDAFVEGMFAIDEELKVRAGGGGREDI